VLSLGSVLSRELKSIGCYKDDASDPDLKLLIPAAVGGVQACAAGEEHTRPRKL